MPKLSQIQQETAEKIVRIGREMGKNDTQIETAIKVGYIESSLGENKGKNPNSSAQGLYQYLDGTWKSHQGSRDNDEDSIRAFYKDMQTFDNRYAQHQQDREKDPTAYSKRPVENRIPADIKRDEYIYTKHHDGPNASADSFNRDGNLEKGINIYNDRVARANGANEIADQVMKDSQHGNSKTQEPKQLREDASFIQKQQTSSILDYFKRGAAEADENEVHIWRR